MDLSCIILSGDLELYVLGMLPEDEAYKVEQLALLFPEIRAELDRISETLEGLAGSTTATPPPALKTNLMNQLAELKSAEDLEEKPDTSSKHMYVSHKVEAEENEKEPPVIGTSTNRRYTLLLAASVVALIMALGFLVHYANQSRERANAVSSLQRRTDSLNQNLALQQQQMQHYGQTIEVMQSPEFRKINLTSIPGRPQGLAQVFWNRNTSEVFVADHSLPALPTGKQYQLWAIIEGKPVDAGLITDVKRVVQKMKNFDKADVFAISIENRGGSA
ncbi:MAG TPA: anti-sigma factor, partial [Chitinophagaceae bacterium]|nr:anti-sigma factor [Chitinophagaceae bacterium]